MDYLLINSVHQLQGFCDEIPDAAAIAFDTEFVSEDSYRPDLCLIQVAVNNKLAIIDAKKTSDTTPFWRLLTEPDRTSIAHGAREEVRFCLHTTGGQPANLFDVQIAAGMVGFEYPAAYRTLAERILNQRLKKGETRTDWRRRPLSSRQLDYALMDVVYLHELYDYLSRKLAELDRGAWLSEEVRSWQESIARADSQNGWRRMSGLSNLSPRSLAVARELWKWRESQAKQRNRPARRVLRDDLIVELAKRQTADRQRIRAVRGLERRDLNPHLPAISTAIERALAIDDSQCPAKIRKQNSPQLAVLTQLLNAALSCICRQAQISPGLVGSSQDIRDLVNTLLAPKNERPSEKSHHPPALAAGWRKEIVGRKIEDVLLGKVSLRVVDPLGEQPVVLEPLAKLITEDKP